MLGVVAAVAGVAWIGMLLGLLVGSAAVVWVLRGADARILGAVRAHTIPAGAEPRLANLVDGLCVSNGLPLPTLAVVDSPAINCLSVGRSPDTTTLAFTRGLLDGLDRVQLEGVVARQLAQVKSGETHLGTVVAAFGFVPGLAARAIPPRYDLLADLEGVGLTRYPPGLTAALERARDATGVAAAPRASSHLWLGDPTPTGVALAGTVRSPIDERIATLQEL